MNLTYFAYLLVVAVVVPFSAWVWLGRRLRRAVPDPERRGRAWRRKLKVQRAEPWTHIGLLAVTLIAGIILLRFTLGNRLPIRLSVTSTLALMVVMIVLVYIQLVIGHVRERRFFDRLEREEYLICPECHYSLGGHGAGGRCPECGYEFSPESLIADWIDVMYMARRRTRPGGRERS